MAAVLLAIVLTVIASSSSNIGKAFQKEASRHLPPLDVGNAKVVREYVESTRWRLGLALDFGGGALQTIAFALAPVSLLQPVSGVGLAGLALYSQFALHDNLTREEWVAVAVACLGTLGLGVSSAADSASEHAASFWRMFVVLVATGWVVLQKMAEVRDRVGGRSKKMGAALLGMQAGGMFGLSASTVRTGFIMRSHRWTWAPFGLVVGVVMSSYGFVLQTSGLKEGSAVIVCTCLAVSSMVVGVVTGIAGLGEVCVDVLRALRCSLSACCSPPAHTSRLTRVPRSFDSPFPPRL